jgi:alpha-beta hydrolase superfamily lysophospholipase
MRSTCGCARNQPSSNSLLNISPLIALSLGILAMSSCTSLPKAQPALGATKWTSFDGKQMPWHIAAVPRGTTEHAVVITVHGLSGAASDFWLLNERLPPQGITVCSYELRGQGNDPDLGKHGDIRSGDLWLRDLLTFHQLQRARHPGVPIIWYGESLGSLIALHAAALREASPDAMVLASPVAGLRTHLGELERFLLRTSSRVLPTYKVKLGDLAGVDESKIRVTAVSTHGGQMAKTPHHVASFTLRLLREMDTLMQRTPVAAQHLDLPVLMLGSPHDVVSSPEQVQTLFDQLGSQDKQLHWYAKSYHLLLHDVQHEEVMADLLGWLKRRTKQE